MVGVFSLLSNLEALCDFASRSAFCISESSMLSLNRGLSSIFSSILTLLLISLNDVCIK